MTRRAPVTTAEGPTDPTPLAHRLAVLRLTSSEQQRLGCHGDLWLQRAWPRGADHVLLEYRHTRGRLAGQWFADRDRAEVVAAGIGRQWSRERDRPAPVTVTRAGVLLQARGADRRLAGLAALVEHPGAVLVSHRPERRGVVRLDVSAGRRTQRRWAKSVPPDRLAGLLDRAAALPADIAIPRLVTADHTAGTAVFGDVPGRALHDLLGAPRLPQRLAAVGAAVARLHAAALPRCHAHGPSQERDTLTGWIARLAPHDPAATAVIQAALPAVLALLQTGSIRLASVHRDLHDKQLLLADGRVGFLDLDTLAPGEPELDLANLIAHVRLRALQGRLGVARVDEAAAALLAGYGPDAVNGQRLRAYTAAALLRLAAVYACRPGWRRLVRPLTTAAGLEATAGRP